MAIIENETPKVTEFNGETGETVIRELNAEELAQRELDAQEQAQRLAKEEAKASARASLLSKLEALGISPEELETL